MYKKTCIDIHTIPFHLYRYQCALMPFTFAGSPPRLPRNAGLQGADHRPGETRRCYGRLPQRHNKTLSPLIKFQCPLTKMPIGQTYPISHIKLQSLSLGHSTWEEPPPPPHAASASEVSKSALAQTMSAYRSHIEPLCVQCLLGSSQPNVRRTGFGARR